MIKTLLPAAIMLSVLSLPAAAVEGTLDGVVYSLPGDSRFELQTLHLPEPDRLQEKVDELRNKTPTGSLMVLFRSRPNSKDAARTIHSKPPQRLETVLTLFRDPATPPDYRVAIDQAIKAAVFRDGVANLRVSKQGSDKPMFARSYAIRTGLGFAPEADAHCDDTKIGTRCFVDVARPGRVRLRWTSLILDEGSPQAVLNQVRDIIASALPVETQKERRKVAPRR